MFVADLVHQFLPDDAVVQMSSALGEPPQRTHAAVKAAVPVLLRLYAYMASHPDGPEKLGSTVRRHSVSSPRGLASYSRGEILEFGQQNYQPLFHLFSRGALDGLNNAISRFSGISLSSARPLLGVVNSAALAVLSERANPQQPSELATFLNENAADIEAAIPAGLHEYLADFPELHDATQRHYDAGVSATGNDLAMENEAEIPRQENYHNERYYEKDQAAGIPGSLAWIVPLIVILVIGAALLFTIAPKTAPGDSDEMAVAPQPIVTNTPEQTLEGAQPAGATIQPVSPFAQLRTPADAELPRQLESAVNQLLIALPAQDDRAVKELEQVRLKLEDLSPRVERLPAQQRQDVSATMQTVMPSIRNAVPKVPEAARQSAGQVIQQLERIAGPPTT